jgi:hypothetical protein
LTASSTNYTIVDRLNAVFASFRRFSLFCLFVQIVCMSTVLATRGNYIGDLKEVGKWEIYPVRGTRKQYSFRVETAYVQLTGVVRVLFSMYSFSKNDGCLEKQKTHEKVIICFRVNE